jgi:signal transduction histidine kinase
MDEQHTPIIEALVRLPDSLPAAVVAVRCERQLRPLLMRMLQHAADAARRRAVSIGSIDRIGLVILSHPFVHQWSEADLQPYQATAAQLAAAIDSRRQYLLLIERGQRLAVLEERQRLARELPDSVTQLVFSMTLIAQSIAPAWRRDSAEGERRVARL